MSLESTSTLSFEKGRVYPGTTFFLHSLSHSSVWASVSESNVVFLLFLLFFVFPCQLLLVRQATETNPGQAKPIEIIRKTRGKLREWN